VIQAEGRWRVAATEVLVQYLRYRLHRLTNPGFSRQFSLFDDSGLSHARAGQVRIRTDALLQFERTAERLDGGTIVLVGPRGAGKTTILEAYTGGRWHAERRPGIVLVENAPIEYQARDFALHLYARLCREVVRLARSHTAVEAGPVYSLLRRLQRHRRVLFAGLPVVLLTGSVLAAAVGWAGTWLPAVVAGAVAASAVVAGAVLRTPAGLWPARLIGMEPADPPPVDLESLRRQAYRRLLHITFLQRNTVGWSGRMSAAGLDSSTVRSVELAQQTLTHPEVVFGLREFLERTVDVLVREFGRLPAPVVIAIDELDRLPAEKAYQFVDEIKALLSPPLPGCLNLMSVSDAALHSFGLPASIFRWCGVVP